jgi:hypothetical protein
MPAIPERISAIQDAGLKERATEAWGAANDLLGCIRPWQDWLTQLRTTGDADPGHAMLRNETVARCATILIRLGINSKSFRGKTVGDIRARFPPTPIGDKWQPAIFLEDCTVLSVTDWQKTYPLWREIKRSSELIRFEDELRGILGLLKTAPSTAFLADPVTPGSQPAPNRLPEDRGEAPPATSTRELVTIAEVAIVTKIGLGTLEKLDWPVPIVASRGPRPARYAYDVVKVWLSKQDKRGVPLPDSFEEFTHDLQ